MVRRARPRAGAIDGPDRAAGDSPDGHRFVFGFRRSCGSRWVGSTRFPVAGSEGFLPRFPRQLARSLARRRAVGVVAAIALAVTLLVSAGVTAQQDPPLPTLTITPNTHTVNENAGTITFTATLSRAYAASSGTDVTFGYHLRGDDEADHEATEGEDFEYGAGEPRLVTIEAGQRSAHHRSPDHRRCPRRIRRGHRPRAEQSELRGVQRQHRPVLRRGAHISAWSLCDRHDPRQRRPADADAHHWKPSRSDDRGRKGSPLPAHPE